MNLSETRTHSPILTFISFIRDVLVIVAMCIFALSAYAETDVSLPTTGENLGATNPVGAADTNMFRDDELSLWGAARDTASPRFFPGAPTKDDLTTWDFNFSAPPIEWGLPGGWSFAGGQVTDDTGKSDYSYPIMSMAYGRVIDPEHDEVVVVGIDYRDGMNVQVRIADDPGTAERSFKLYYPAESVIEGVDVAVGDLDRVVDDNGYFHDEIVVVWGRTAVFGGCTAAIEVLDSAWAQIADARRSVSGCTGHVATAIGDFNADGDLEFVAVTNDEESLRALVCGLVQDEPGQPPQWHLECLPEYVVDNPEGFPSLDVAAGNVLGLGKEEIILITSPAAASAANWFRVTILGLDPAQGYQTVELHRTFASNDSHIGGVVIPGVHEVRGATGLFRYDPAAGYDFGNRQLVTAALGVSSGNQTADLWFWDIPATDEPARVLASGHTLTSGRHTAKPSLAVGNFAGHGLNGDQTDPTMQAALTYLHTTSDNLADGTKVTQKSSVWALVPPASSSSLGPHHNDGRALLPLIMASMAMTPLW